MIKGVKRRVFESPVEARDKGRGEKYYTDELGRIFMWYRNYGSSSGDGEAAPLSSEESEIGVSLLQLRSFGTTTADPLCDRTTGQNLIQAIWHRRQDVRRTAKRPLTPNRFTRCVAAKETAEEVRVREMLRTEEAAPAW
eukprot:CAMPEP_0197288788 /NCGR_PEP_ID=MMETSP0890-20130614/5955_1 /TAXON_ID=44058 ORGANISM="Aureoumbra lagunensis, Strain CCMP1510" /NCGR_SAMPLE_ID=MMETSP0890 /ASSEMBLY_ACC=CAM_ASM_000533 /LENGTH=138 /DNA_ID=CAMNT_0042759769 /DNA_START=145 /DNA_END=558 /DNA_ORIENTATION=-